MDYTLGIVAIVVPAVVTVFVLLVNRNNEWKKVKHENKKGIYLKSLKTLNEMVFDLQLYEKDEYIQRLHDCAAEILLFGDENVYNNFNAYARDLFLKKMQKEKELSKLENEYYDCIDLGNGEEDWVQVSDYDYHYTITREKIEEKYKFKTSEIRDKNKSIALEMRKDLNNK